MQILKIVRQSAIRSWRGEGLRLTTRWRHRTWRLEQAADAERCAWATLRSTPPTPTAQAGNITPVLQMKKAGDLLKVAQPGSDGQGL